MRTQYHIAPGLTVFAANPKFDATEVLLSAIHASQGEVVVFDDGIAYLAAKPAGVAAYLTSDLRTIKWVLEAHGRVDLLICDAANVLNLDKFAAFIKAVKRMADGVVVITRIGAFATLAGVDHSWIMTGEGRALVDGVECRLTRRLQAPAA